MGSPMSGTLMEALLGNPLLTLFVVVGLGLLLGKIEVGGISLGSSGVIFSALLAGHLGGVVPPEAGTIGLVLFVYCVGIGAGGRFFGALKREGSELAKLALAVVVSGALVTWGLAALLDLSPGLAVGIFAGAMTSTPALAAAMEGIGELGHDVVVGYGVAYPFGVIGIVLFVQLLPRVLGLNLDDGQDEESPLDRITRQVVEVTNPSMVGRPVSHESLATIGACRVSRILREGRMVPVRYEDTFREGQRVLLVGEKRAVAVATDLLGKAIDEKLLLDTEDERGTFTVTSKAVVGRSLGDLDPLKDHGVVVTRISRMEMPFVPDGSTHFEPHDVLTVVGPKEQLVSFSKVVGHRPSASSETSLLSLAIGLALGIVVGGYAIPLPGGLTFSLGLAGGPLLVALLLGHFGRVGGIVGHIPRPTRMLLQEMGLVFFLADAGVRGGTTLVDALAAQGLQIFLIGAVISIIPMIVGYLVARRYYKMTLAKSLGGICGGMTSTPALGAMIAKTNRQAPIVSYATVYPVAVILMALLTKILIQLIS